MSDEYGLKNILSFISMLLSFIGFFLFIVFLFITLKYLMIEQHEGDIYLIGSVIFSVIGLLLSLYSAIKWDGKSKLMANIGIAVSLPSLLLCMMFLQDKI